MKKIPILFMVLVVPLGVFAQVLIDPNAGATREQIDQIRKLEEQISERIRLQGKVPALSPETAPAYRPLMERPQEDGSRLTPQSSV